MLEEIKSRTVVEQLLELPIDSIVRVAYKNGDTYGVLQRTGNDGWLNTRGSHVPFSNAEMAEVVESYEQSDKKFELLYRGVEE